MSALVDPVSATVRIALAQNSAFAAAAVHTPERLQREPADRRDEHRQHRDQIAYSTAVSRLRWNAGAGASKYITLMMRR